MQERRVEGRNGTRVARVGAPLVGAGGGEEEAMGTAAARMMARWRVATSTQQLICRGGRARAAVSKHSTRSNLLVRVREEEEVTARRIQTQEEIVVTWRGELTGRKAYLARLAFRLTLRLWLPPRLVPKLGPARI